MEPLEILSKINDLIGIIFTLCYAYQFFYLIVPLFRRKQPDVSPKPHRVAILICARNEEAVLGHLLDTIRQQDYPADQITTFVCADNCTDRTAEVAAHGGAVVYERFNRQLVGKGYALSELLQHIRRDHGDCFDGFLVLDADNLLSENYVTELNKTFSQGYDVVTSYRNSKNFGDNWISSGYALWFLREAAFLNRPRMMLGTACAVSGTGFLFSREVLDRRGGWNCFLLTEDIEFTVANVLAGEKMGYCGTAVLYDEQPVTFRQSWRQRMRWAKGYLQVFGKYGGSLLRGLAQKHGFACFDMAMAIMPAIVLTALGISANVALVIASLCQGIGIWASLQPLLGMIGSMYGLMLLLGGITTVTQWKQIYAPAWKKILFTLTFPLFMMTYIPISLAAMFRKVEWKPIEHKAAMSLSDVAKKR